jgi:glycosyltransferase involved in cell wall biosynthesis
MAPTISVCIPAYNRASVLPVLLDSILQQEFRNFEVLICEDCSPERKSIQAIVCRYQQEHPGMIRYVENEANLGYDGNLRRLVDLAEGDYCLFMGNDDVMCPGALASAASAVTRYQNVGVVLRSYAAFDESPDKIVQEFRYFPKETFFPAGEKAIATIFRRSVVISGMVVHREAAHRYASDRFDGSLLYQLYLVASILTVMNAVYLPTILVLYRNGGVPDFGNSEKERGKFVPKEHTPESSLHFMRSMLDIVRYVEEQHGVRIYDPILRDIGNYSYPVLAIQADKPLPVFWNYARKLGAMGFWTNKMFYLYLLLLTIMSPKVIDRLIGVVKRRLGYTPVLGSVYRGKPV